MALNGIHRPRTPNSFLWLWPLHLPPDFSNWTPQICISWPGFILGPCICSNHRFCFCHKGLKQPLDPKGHPCVHVHSMAFPLLRYGGLYSLFKSELKLHLLGEPSPVLHSRQGPCPPGHLKEFRSICLSPAFIDVTIPVLPHGCLHKCWITTLSCNRAVT